MLTWCHWKILQIAKTVAIYFFFGFEQGRIWITENETAIKRISDKQTHQNPTRERERESSVTSLQVWRRRTSRNYNINPNVLPQLEFNPYFFNFFKRNSQISTWCQSRLSVQICRIRLAEDGDFCQFSHIILYNLVI